MRAGAGRTVAHQGIELKCASSLSWLWLSQGSILGHSGSDTCIVDTASELDLTTKSRLWRIGYK